MNPPMQSKVQIETTITRYILVKTLVSSMPWTIASIAEQPIATSAFQCLDQSTQYGWSHQLPTPHQPDSSWRGHKMRLTNPDNEYLLPVPTASDILELLRPQLFPANVQVSPSVEQKHQPKESYCKKKDKDLPRTRTEVQQPTNTHGTFGQHLWDPRAVPSFDINQPISDGLQPLEGLLLSYGDDANPLLNVEIDAMDVFFNSLD
ncbi:hypothetical protein BU23DRAFT_642836 [Bimuria novae-zelandiae CBS 107.79]|uniref:Uncharacterized protein n=1 Tax=Bimuria novae-zelandiae CBS 107.79 TaxID=1447943 RepID=A0A6A5VQV0_9PLEO|nr:hypothetical protein BU23DRAFT_642836 [Bimuria novae-zelandiae CBS 107.79]